MAVRHLKIIFVSLISLLCLFYAGQNLVNVDACFQAFAYVMGGVDHEVYPNSIFPAVQTPALIWLVLTLVVASEFVAGLLAAKGAWDLWLARKATAADFNGAKTFALTGCGMGIVVWLGLFGVFGSALFQMWQTEIGQQSMGDAFELFASCALIFLIVNNADD
jgi:predicted small integral membrane protein